MMEDRMVNKTMANMCVSDHAEVFTWRDNISEQDGMNVQILASISTAICVLGFIGNAMSTVVLHKVTKLNKGVRLLKYLSMVDCAVLVLLFLSSFMRYLQYRSMQILYVMLDPIAFIAGVTLYTCEIYLTVLIAIERCLAVAAPVKYRSFKRDLFIRRMLVSFFLFSILFNVPHWVAFQPQLTWNCNLTMYVFKIRDDTFFNSTAYNQIYNGYITLVFRSILPMFTLIVCNIVLVISRRKVPQKAGGSRARDGRSQVTFIIIIITFVSVITHILSGTINTISLDSTTQYYMDTLLSTAIAINSSVNFVVCFSLSRDFRKTCFSMLKNKGNYNAVAR